MPIVWFSAIDPKYWSSAYFLYKRYEFLTNNMNESMTSCLRRYIKLPIVALVEKTTYRQIFVNEISKVIQAPIKAFGGLYLKRTEEKSR